MKNIFYNIAEIDQISKNIISEFSSNIICFEGEMGAGKTTLIKAIVKILDGDDAVQSPTFSLVNEYHKKDGSLLGYHFDFYRIEDISEALDIGLEDYLNQDCYVFIEWPEKIEELLPDEVQLISLEIAGPDLRKLTLH